MHSSVQEHASPCKATHPHANTPLHTFHVQKAPCTLTPMCSHTFARPYSCIEPRTSTSMCATLCLCTPMCKHLLAHPRVLHSCITAPSLHSPRAHRRVQIDHYTFDMHPCATSLAHSCANSALATPISRCVQPHCAMFCTLTCMQMRAQLHTHVQNIPVHSHAALLCTRMCTNPWPSATATCAKPHSHVQRTPFTLPCSCTSVKRRPIAHSQAQPALHVATCNAHACAKPTIHLQSPLAHPLVQAHPGTLHPSTRIALHTHTPLTATPR